jgi:uncharacterized protein (TIGR02145 family)/prepilin-type N-terminal cleavage/methylation domain-containing protein
MTKRPAFTLIELVVAVAILGLVVAATMISLDRVRSNARNLKRLDDIKQVQTALQAYFIDEHEYPPTISFGSEFTGSSSATVYMRLLPNNPTPRTDGSCAGNDYSYEVYDGGRSYKIEFCLSGSTGNLSAGIKCATPQGILNQACFVCGESQVSYEGINYHTVQIGDDCWLKENLNVGTMVLSQVSSPCQENPHWAGLWSCQIDPNSIEKYCYSDTESNCTSYGGLYEWSEAMGFPYQCNDATFTYNGTNYTSDCGTGTTYIIETQHQGICPQGWHVSNNSEFGAAIIAASADPGCTPGWDGSFHCSPAGTKMKNSTADTIAWDGDNATDFSAQPSGFRFYNGAFLGLGSAAQWHTTGAYGSAMSNYNYMASGNSAVAGYIDGFRIYGFGVRCVKDSQ